jgi:hypothetical protein
MAIRRYLAALVLAPLLGAQGGAGVHPPPTPVPSDLLDQLVGVWDITGTAGPNPIHERAIVEWILNRQFLRIHRQQIDGPDEAVLEIGFDPLFKQFVQFRFDTFGARGAETPAYGLQKGDNKLEFTFLYPTQLFRETWTLDPKERTWQFLSEYGPKNPKGVAFTVASTMTWHRFQGGRGGGRRGPPPQRPQSPQIPPQLPPQ